MPMFGVGNSIFLYFNAMKINGMKEMKEMPYPMRLGKMVGTGWANGRPFIRGLRLMCHFPERY